LEEKLRHACARHKLTLTKGAEARIKANGDSQYPRKKRKIAKLPSSSTETLFPVPSSSFSSSLSQPQQQNQIENTQTKTGSSESANGVGQHAIMPHPPAPVPFFVHSNRNGGPTSSFSAEEPGGGKKEETAEYEIYPVHINGDDDSFDELC